MRKNLKILLSVLLILSMIFSFVACSNGEDIKKDVSNTTHSTTETENSSTENTKTDIETPENTNNETNTTTDENPTQNSDKEIAKNETVSTESEKTNSSNNTQTSQSPSNSSSNNTKPSTNNKPNTETTKPTTPTESKPTEPTKPSVVKTNNVSLNISNKEIYIGDSFMLSATVSPSNATDKNVTWDTTNSKIATVSLGKVTGQNIGTAKITVTNSGGQTDTCIVTVKEKETTSPPSQPNNSSSNTAPPDTNTSDSVTADALKQIEEGFVKLVNEERKAKGLSPLTIDIALDKAAQTRSAEAITKWSHTRPDGTPFYTAIDKNKYSYVIAGENLGMTTHVGNGSVSTNNVYTGSSQQIKDVYTWMFTILKNSPSHYANMINENYTNTGIGISYTYYGNVPMFYVSQIFGSLK